MTQPLAGGLGEGLGGLVVGRVMDLPALGRLASDWYFRSVGWHGPFWARACCGSASQGVPNVPNPL